MFVPSGKYTVQQRVVCIDIVYEYTTYTVNLNYSV